MSSTVYAFDVVLQAVRGLKHTGKMYATVQRFGGDGGARRMEAKTQEIDTARTTAFPAALFRVLVADSIYDRIIVTLVCKKTFGTEVLGMCVIPASSVSTMATMPRAVSVSLLCAA